MEILTLRDLILVFFAQIDRTLLSDPKDDPFIQISIINMSSYNTHKESLSLYLTKPGTEAEHIELSTVNMSKADILEGKYLAQKPTRAKPIEDTTGCVRGLSLGNKQLAIISVVTNLEDAQFVATSAINEIIIFLKKEK